MPEEESPEDIRREWASQGGKARAESLSAEARRAIARNAIAVRWQKEKGDNIPRASHDGTLPLGEIPCAVLPDGTRVLSERGVTKALGGKRGGSHWRRMKENPTGAVLPVFLSANNLKPFISN